MNANILPAALLAVLLVLPGLAMADDLADARLGAAIKTEFVNQRGVPPTVRVDVTHQVATLSGTVYSTFAQQRAEEVAEAVPGVRVVINYTVVDFIPRDDRAIRKDVERALARDETVESYETSVTVRAGVVHLTGSVDSAVEKLAAERAAWDVAGVLEVENRLGVLPPATRSDAEILEDVLHQLSWDPALDEEMLHVSVHDGRVFVTGYVGTVDEKQRARRGARVAGVRGVDTDSVEVAYFARDDNRVAIVVPVGSGAADTEPGEASSARTSAALLPVHYLEDEESP